MKTNRIVCLFSQFALSIAFLSLISACGGSGGSDPPVQNQAPIANAGAAQTIDEQSVVTLSGSGNDSDGTIVSYRWSQTSGNTVTLAEPLTASPTFDAPSTPILLTLEFQLTVTDNGGMSGSDSVTITVNPHNVPLTADAGVDQTVDEGDAVTLSGSASDSIVSYGWAQTSGIAIALIAENTDSVTFTAPIVSQNDFLIFTLTVTDNVGGTAFDTVNIAITDIIANSNTHLNDTGITLCGDYAFGSSGHHGNSEDCSLTKDGGGDSIPADQDGHSGRDVTANYDLDGHAGFSFTKLDASGTPLPTSATDWSCVKDNVTNFIWEVKTTDGGLQDSDNTYSWYNSDSNTNGGDAGTQNGGTCTGSDCDTEAYVNAINAQGLCGASDWYLPSRGQLQSIVDYSISFPGPTLDTNYFRNLDSFYWSSTPSGSTGAWAIFLWEPAFGNYTKYGGGYTVILVRSAQ